MSLEQKTQSPVIHVRTLSGLRKAIDKLQKRTHETFGDGGTINFKGRAHVGVRTENRSDIGNLSTYFKGALSLEIYGNNPSGLGCYPCIYYYAVRNKGLEHPCSIFEYWVDDVNTPPLWQQDRIYDDATKLAVPIGKGHIFPLAQVLLLWVDSKKEQPKFNGVLIRT